MINYKLFWHLLVCFSLKYIQPIIIVGGGLKLTCSVMVIHVSLFSNIRVSSKIDDCVLL